MKKSYVRYYEALSGIAPLHFFWDMLFLRRPVARVALKNRLDDYRRLSTRPDLLPLHHRLNQIIYDAIALGDFYDYGEGYFYQSLEAIGVTGLRNTEKRLEAMHLKKWVSGKRVLEVGCNTGFLSLGIAQWAQSLTGFDIMPHLIEIAQITASHLHVNNAVFINSSFEEFRSGETYDVVISFANHATYDGQTRHKLHEYFDKCFRCCNAGGLLLFESHPPKHEGDGLPHVLRLIAERFTIVEQHVLAYGTFLDTGRTFLVARKA